MRKQGVIGIVAAIAVVAGAIGLTVYLNRTPGPADVTPIVGAWRDGQLGTLTVRDDGTWSYGGTAAKGLRVDTNRPASCIGVVLGDKDRYVFRSSTKDCMDVEGKWVDEHEIKFASVTMLR